MRIAARFHDTVVSLSEDELRFRGKAGTVREPRRSRSQSVKTARFATVVEKSGKPQTYLALMDPANDRTLQTAIKTHRVMTVIQNSAGHAADHGLAGFEKGTNRQFLIFPKSIQRFAGSKVVGIKYDLFQSPEVPKKDRAPRPKERKPPVSVKRKSTASRERKVIPFATETASHESPEAAQLKRQIRQAMSFLEEGKEVAAFNTLKKALEK